jgi:ATP-binding cassette subfamily B (MDR/TAP) protein 1
MNVIFGRFVGEFTNINLSDFENTISTLSLYMLGLFLGRFILNYINKLCFRMIGIRLSAAIRVRYLRCLLQQSVHVLDSMPPGYATSTITTTSNTLQLGISEKLGTFVEYMSTIIASVIVAFVWSWQLTLVTSSALLFILITVSVILPLIVTRNGRMTKSESKATSVASEAFASIRMIAACGAEARTAEKYAHYVRETAKHALSMSPLVSLQFGLVFFSVYAAFGLAFWYGIRLYVNGTITNPGDITVVLLCVMMTVFSLERTSSPLLAVGKATVAACQFFTVIDAPLPNKGSLKAPDIKATDDIVLEDVTFAYPSRPHVKILDHLDLRIEAGKITAIVGPSGSGKSTIVGLIERWYTLQDQYVIEKAIEKKKETKKSKKKGSTEEDSDAEDENIAEQEDTGPPIKLEGRISTAGRSLDEIDLKWWRTQIGLVQQEPFLFNETIFTNVAQGLVGSEWESESEEKKLELVKEACAEAFADEFIDKLPKVCPINEPLYS